MISVIDEVLNTAATDNKVKYTLTRQDGTSEIVQIDLATPVTTQGTPLNRALFNQVNDFISNTISPTTITTTKVTTTTTTTQTGTFTTLGHRYILIVWTTSDDSPVNADFSILDCKTNIFALSGSLHYSSSATIPSEQYPIDRNSTTARIYYHNNHSVSAKATFSYNPQTKEVTMTFTIKSNSDQNVPALKGTIYELGGFEETI